MTNKKLIIAVDFDGTLVEERYPEIGKPIENAFEVLIKLHNDGHRLLLWTYRKGDRLEEAVTFCRSKGIEFYAVNKNFPEEEWTSGTSRKLLADLYIDDRNFGGLPSWNLIYQRISGKIFDGKKKKWRFFLW